jgi:hypothetical protein
MLSSLVWACGRDAIGNLKEENDGKISQGNSKFVCLIWSRTGKEKTCSSRLSEASLNIYEPINYNIVETREHKDNENIKTVSIWDHLTSELFFGPKNKVNANVAQLFIF